VVLRGESAQTDEIALTQAPEILADGRVRVAWSPHPDADGYRIVLLSPDGQELSALAAGPDPSLVLDPSRLPGTAASGGVLWRVEALRDGDEIARSRVAALPLR